MNVLKSQEVTSPFHSRMDMMAAGCAEMGRRIDVMDEAFALLGKGDCAMGGAIRNAHRMRLWFPLEPEMPEGGPERRFSAMSASPGGRFRVCGNRRHGSSIRKPSKHGLPRSIPLMPLGDAETARPRADVAGIPRQRAGPGLSAGVKGSPSGNAGAFRRAGRGVPAGVRSRPDGDGGKACFAGGDRTGNDGMREGVPKGNTV